MAPGRKRGAKGVKTTSELSIGDLVLAKVKGFPAWPAKISIPEEFGKSPDPKKYFVNFFGTGEIAFVAPADIQPFSSELKSKLSARYPGKGQISVAVKAICAAFEELQQKNSCPLGLDTNKEALVSDGVDDTKVEQTDRADSGESKHVIGSESPGDCSSLERCSKIKPDKDNHNFERCSKIKPDKGNHNLKPHFFDSVNSPPTILSKRESKIARYTNSVKELTSASGKGPQESLKNKNAPHKLNSGNDAELPGSRRAHVTNGWKEKLTKRKLEGGDLLQNVNILGGDTSAEAIAVGLRGDDVPSECKQKISLDLKPCLEANGKKKSKKLQKDKRHLEMAGSENEIQENNKFGNSGVSSKVELGCARKNLQGNEGNHPLKRSKCVDGACDVNKVIQASRNTDSRSSGADVRLSNSEVKGSKPGGKVHNCVTQKEQAEAVEFNIVGVEDVPPPSKRSRRALESMPCTSPIPQNPTKRRAVRICDDDGNGEPKTPVHGGSVKKDCNPTPISTPLKKSDAPSISSTPALQGLRVSGRDHCASSKELKPPTKPNNDNSFHTSERMPKKRARLVTTPNVSSSPVKLEPSKVPLKDIKPIFSSPRRSPVAVTAVKPVLEPQKPRELSDNVLDVVAHEKVVDSSLRAPVAASDNLKSCMDQSSSERGKEKSSIEKKEENLISVSGINDHALAAGHPTDTVSVPSERVEAGRDDQLLSLTDFKVSDTDMSMKNLIAAAQAKRRQAHLQNAPGNLHPIFSTYADIQGGSPNLDLPSHPFGHGKFVHSDTHGLCPRLSPVSEFHQLSSIDPPECEEQEERRVSSEHWTTGGSLSGSTEAAVARDAFEGMIETLSRTKESIGRATRLAIDCAKYGIANEVVELLILKLENEPSYHRRVDLFFLVDSITQCSHSHKGIASASYIPAVQEALSRLLLAAAPPGAGSRENRRQCLKVLRLWLERKILPESLLRRHIDEIGTGNDDVSAGGHSFRCPSRAERALDDPIREMEDMEVDEYGSNTCKLPGFLSSNVFEEEDEEILNSPPQEVTEISQVDDPAIRDNTEQYAVTLKDRRSHILEDVDGELEMEDVSEHQKEDSPLFTDSPFGNAPNQPGSERVLEAVSKSPLELPPFVGFSPPLPPGSPPETPPLPSSPPPQPPSSFPPPPPIPCPPSLPLILPSQPHPFPSIPSGPPPHLFSLPSMPLQPSLPLQHLQSVASSVPSSSPMVAYQQPLAQHDICSMQNGHRLPQMSVNASHGPQSHSVPVGVCNTLEPSAYNDAYINLPHPQSGQQFQPTNAPFPQRPMHPNPPPQTPHNNFSYTRPVVQQNSQHPYPPGPPAYPLPYRPDRQWRYVGDEQWRVQSNEFTGDQHRGLWMGGGRSSGGLNFPPEGYLRPHDRPPMNNIGFQPNTSNAPPTGGPISGHGMPSRPDVTALMWRPA